MGKQRQRLFQKLKQNVTSKMTKCCIHHNVSDNVALIYIKVNHNKRPKGTSSWLSTKVPALIFNHNASYYCLCQHSQCSKLLEYLNHFSSADCWKITIAKRENPPPLHKLGRTADEESKVWNRLGNRANLGRNLDADWAVKQTCSTQHILIISRPHVLFRVIYTKSLGSVKFFF